MTRRSKKMLIPLHIGQNCTPRMPDVDRGPADPKNFWIEWIDFSSFLAGSETKRVSPSGEECYRDQSAAMAQYPQI
ncbi:hypothetical protein T07_8432 [Trichinella nelsoni]|uniref:Uncharacterized protein n=1 Tax=Trichinella nelsoni TaxID=6336 RepID=A0A0V0S2R4_9BILA|nr:hypothetical protein T07_8432 [Trichinella nelsoni]